MIAPAGTPDAVVAKLNQAVNEALKTDKSLRQMIESSGGQIMGGNSGLWQIPGSRARQVGAGGSRTRIFRWTNPPELLRSPGREAAPARSACLVKADGWPRIR
jgi:hypothetical protein